MKRLETQALLNFNNCVIVYFKALNETGTCDSAYIKAPIFIYGMGRAGLKRAPADTDKQCVYSRSGMPSQVIPRRMIRD